MCIRSISFCTFLLAIHKLGWLSEKQPEKTFPRIMRGEQDISASQICNGDRLKRLKYVCSTRYAYVIINGFRITKNDLKEIEEELERRGMEICWENPIKAISPEYTIKHWIDISFRIREKSKRIRL